MGGTALLVTGFVAAVAGAMAAFLVIRGDRDALRWSRLAGYAHLAIAGLAALLLLGMILGQRYDVAYVYQYTSRDLNIFYRLSAFWAGQQGSFLLWLFLGAVFTVWQIRRARQFEPYVLFFLLLTQAGLSLFLLVESPFQPLGRQPADGFGLNPLLQSPWMVAHPPVLFVGYAGLAVPFAYAMGGLWRRDYDDWVTHALPWHLIGWFFLGLGIYLGAYWAYETLGWGGYWGWDLVENSSLIPWLTGTALLHGLLIQRYRRRLRQGNLILAIVTFLLIIYASYLTRSGVLSEISTHSFVEGGLNAWMLGMLALMAAIGIGLLASRWTDIPHSPVFAESAAEVRPRLEGDVAGTVGQSARSLLSRDLTILLTMWTLLLLTAPIWVGTLVPVITRLWGSSSALETSFYPRTTAPSLVLLLAVLAFCPLLGWRGSDWRRLARLLTWPAVAALVVIGVALVLGAHQPLALLFFFLGGFALATNVAMIVHTVRGGILRLGGYLAHVGLGLLVVGVIASSVYNVEGPSLILEAGRPQEALGYRFTFAGWQEVPGAKPALRLQVERGRRRFTALPELYTNPQDGSLVATPHVERTLTHDVYIAAEGYEPAGGEEEITLGEGQGAEVGGYRMTLRALVASDEGTAVVLDVETAERTWTITPTYAPPGAGAPGQPASLPGGDVFVVDQVYMPPPGLLLLVEGEPVVAGPYTVTLLGFHMARHGEDTETVQAGAVVQFAGPAGTTVLTPTQVVGPRGVEAVPVELAPGVTVQIDRLAVDQRAVWVDIVGADLPRQPGVAWLRLQSPEGVAARARVQVSIKPGINLLWLGGILLLLGTALAVVRRWREKRRLA